MRITLLSLLSISIGILFSACVPMEVSNPGDKWQYADLRILAKFGELKPEFDFIAGYTRLAGSDLQIRFDFLDLKLLPETDIYIALDTRPGGTYDLPLDHKSQIEWDNLLVLPASGSPQVLISDSDTGSSERQFSNSEHPISDNPIPRIVRIPWQDYIVTSINASLFPDLEYGFKVQAFSTSPGSRKVEDLIGPFRSDALPPKPAPLVLAFWNTFPAYTPAQSLRRWDGAHTGPNGERHGLSILLKGIRKTGVPVVLLDLRNPLALSALDHVKAIPQILDLQNNKLLILPDMLPGSPSFPQFPGGLPQWSSIHFLEDLAAATRNFGLKSSEIIYLPNGYDESAENYRLVFTPVENIDIHRFTGTIFLPLPPEKSSHPSATPEGISIPIRKQLLMNALNINQFAKEFPLMVLGGSLLESNFADPQSSVATLSYIAEHPWINPLNQAELFSLPSDTSTQLPPGTTSHPEDPFSGSPILQHLPYPGNNPDNPLYQSAWESALSLYAPLPPETDNLPDLRAIYSGQPGFILEAARWVDNPSPRQNCSSDPDLDGIQECIIASDKLFAILDPQGARLLAFYFLSEGKVHQVVGSTSQFIIGLADPTIWQLDSGEQADTAGIHGAFADNYSPWNLYQIDISGEFIEFTSPDLTVSKKYTLSAHGLRVEINFPVPQSVQIPIAPDPWSRYSPGWSTSHHIHEFPGGHLIRFSDRSKVEILGNAPSTINNFRESDYLMVLPEDPNYDYPPGHYVPYPMGIIETSSRNIIYIDINILPP